MIRQLCNQVVFPIRQRAPSWRKRAYRERLESPLQQGFFPLNVASQLSRLSLGLNCFYASIFEEFEQSLEEGVEDILDIGSMNFFYAPALARLADRKKWVLNSLVGLEADTKRLYRDFYRRKDYAHYYMELAQAEWGFKLSYLSANFQCWRAPRLYGFVTCFFPFLFEDLSLNWGLPLRYFDPEAQYKKMSELSSQILLFHQGEEELALSKLLIEKLGYRRLVVKGAFQENPWIEKKHPVFGLLWKR